MQIIDQVIDRLSREAGDGPAPAPVREAIGQVIDQMIQFAEDIDGAIVSSADGVAWAERLPAGLDRHRFAAMSGALLALCDTLAREGARGEPRNVLIEGEGGRIFLLHAGPRLLLTVFTRAGANLGVCLAHARQAAETIAAVAGS